MIFRFGPFELDAGRFLLTRAGEPVAVEPRVLEMLVYLVEHRDQLVGRDELLDAVWKRRFFGKGLLSQSVYAARQALGDDPRDPRYIETVRGRGVRFIAPVTTANPPDAEPRIASDLPVSRRTSGRQSRRPRVTWLAAGALAAVVAGAGITRMLLTQSEHGRPESIAFLPLVNATEHEEFAWIELGLADMLTRSLDRQPGASVVPTTQVIAALNRLPNDGDDRIGFGVTDALRLARFTGARWVVSGVFSRDRGVFQLWTTIHDTRSHPVSFRLSGSEVLPLADDLNRAVAQRIGAGPPPGLSERYSNDPFTQQSYAAGMQAQIRGNAEEARRYFEMCLERSPEMIWARYELALALRKLGDREESQRLSEEVLVAARSRGDGELASAALNNLGILAWARNQIPEAEAHLIEALAYHRESGLRRGEAANLVNLGILSSQRSNWDDANRRYESALALFRELGDLSGEAVVYNSLGVLAWRRGEVDRSETMHTRALELRRRLGLRAHEAASLHNLGTIAHARGDLDRAVQLFDQALALRQDLGDREGAASTLSTLAAVAIDRGSLAVAESRLRESLAVFRDLGRTEKEAHSVAHLVTVARRRGERDVARRLAGDSVHLFRELADRAGEAAGLAAMAELAAEDGDRGHALELLTAAGRLAEDAASPVVSAALALARGRVAHAAGEYAEAERQFRQALEVSRSAGLGRGHVEAAVDLASLMARGGRRREAEFVLATLPGRWAATPLVEETRRVLLRGLVAGAGVQTGQAIDGAAGEEGRTVAAQLP